MHFVADEIFPALTAPPGLAFTAQAQALLDQLQTIARGFSLVWMRFHISDPANQTQILRELTRHHSAAISIIGQPPANGAKIALEAYAVRGGHVQREGDSARLRLPAYRLLFFNSAFSGKSGCPEQTREEFLAIETAISREGGTLADNLHRTWLYCRDIDNHYAGLVSARNQLFVRHGLTPDSHFISSTGIEGLCDPPQRLVRMDSLAIFGLRPEQVSYLHATDYLPPTHIYGVAFERGTKITYGDRSHFFISGTASIDAQGNILFPGDPSAQTRRLLETVDALLHDGGASLGDIRQAVVYLRDLADTPAVEAILRQSLPAQAQWIIVKGAVCRPGWLVEMDAIATRPETNLKFPQYL